MVIDMLPRVRTVEEIADRLAEEYLDWSQVDEEESIYSMPLNSKMGINEIDEAIFWRDHARGTMGVFGPPGVGKTLLLTAAALKLNYFFKRPVVMDYYPKQAFIDQVGEDNYTYIDEDTLLTDIQEIDKLARNKDWNITKEERSAWVIEGKGSSGVKLHGCTFLISEIDRWVNCRRTGTKINEIITDLFKRWRHYDILVMGDCVDQNDLDRQRIKDRFSCIVFPHPLGDNKFSYLFKGVQKLTKGGVQHIATTERYTLDGRDIYRFYQTRNPISLQPKLRLKEPKEKGGNGHGIITTP